MSEIGKFCQKYLTTRQVADYFSVSTETVRRWGQRGLIKIVKLDEDCFSSILRVEKSSVEKFEKSAKTIKEGE